MKRVILIVVGCSLTWTSAAVGIVLAVRIHHRLFGTHAAETIGAKPEPIVEPATEPPIEVELSCEDSRFHVLRRVVQQYCGALGPQGGDSLLCSNLTKQLNSCRTGSPIQLTHPGDCHPEGVSGVARTRIICHDYLASRWKVVRLEFDDLQRP